MVGDKKGIVLLNLGGPDSLDAVKPFLSNLFSDREIIRLGPSFLQKPIAWMIAATRAGKTKENYKLIGGRSPLLKITNAQADALRATLSRRGRDMATYVGMRYWRPFIHEALEKAVGDGVNELVALPLFPQYSKATTGSCFNQLKKSSSRHEIKIKFIESWHNHPRYIEALADSILVGLREFGARGPNEVAILFSAHALPKSFVEEGDPYVDQVKATIAAVVRVINASNWHLAFQSRSGPVEWITPSTDEMIKRLASEGVKKVLMVPVSFVSDHIETLYEIDILYKKQAEKLGLTLVRAPSLNAAPKFIEALADIVEDVMRR